MADVSDASDVLAAVAAAAVLIVLVALITIVVVKIALCIKTAEVQDEFQSLCEEKEREQRAELEKKRRELEREARQQQEEQARQAQCALAKTVDDARQAAEERYRSGIPDGALEDVDTYLKNAQLRQSHMGRVLTVRVVVLPTGRMVLEWALDPTLAYLVQVVGEKNDKVVFVEHAWRGVYPDTLARGKEYVFSLHAYDGKKDLEPDFEFVVKAPTERQWERKIKERRIEGAVEREQRIVKKIEFIEAEDALWEKARQHGHRRVDESNASDPVKRKRKAALDVKLEEERRREEE